jgi:hypothetical protein
MLLLLEIQWAIRTLLKNVAHVNHIHAAIRASISEAMLDRQNHRLGAISQIEFGYALAYRVYLNEYFTFNASSTTMVYHRT